MSDTAMTIVGFCIIFAATSLGSACVFLFKNKIPEKVNAVFLGFAAGVMLAASIWSLLIPSLDGASSWGKWSFAPAAIGMLIGGIVLAVLDKVIPHFHSGVQKEEGPPSELHKYTKMFLAVTLHNIPEGLAIGFAFGGAAAANDHAQFVSAFGLAIGLAIQNLPEGAAVSLPMKNALGSRGKAFGYGVGSGVVEPIFAVVGYFLASSLTAVQPWLLAFAAGAMIFVVADDLIPDSKLADYPHLGTWGVIAGFIIMMTLDVALS